MIERSYLIPQTVEKQEKRSQIMHTSLNEMLRFGFGRKKEKFNLGNEPLTLTRLHDPVKDEFVYLGLLHHPLSGLHFAQILTAVSPFNQGLSGILADFAMIRTAHRKAVTGREGAYLDRVHRSDPDIGSIFQEFYSQHFDRWQQALKNQECNALYGSISSLIFTYDLHALIDQLSVQWRELNKKSIQSKGELSQDQWHMKHVITTLRRSEFIQFIRDDKQFFQGLRQGSMLSDNQIMYRFESSDSHYRCAFEFIDSLSNDALHTLVKDDLTHQGRIFVDMRNQKVTSLSSNDLQALIVGKEKVQVTDQRGSNIIIQSHMDAYGQFDWKILEHNLTDHEGCYLMPLFAWARNIQNERRYITQKEAQKALLQVGLGEYRKNVDVVVGRVIATQYDDILTDAWDTKIALKKEDGTHTKKQKISGAQVGVWVSLPDHVRAVMHYYDYFKTIEDQIDQTMFA